MVKFLPSPDRGQAVVLADSIRHFKELVIVVVDSIDLALILKILAAHVVEAEYVDQIVLQSIVHRVWRTVVVFIIKSSILFVSVAFCDLKLVSFELQWKIDKPRKAIQS